MAGKKTLLLVNPPANPDVGAQLFLENLGLGSLAASVRKRLGATHRALLWDCPILGRSMTQLREALLTARPDYVGLSLTTMNAHFGVQAAQLVRETAPQAKIILGGILPSTLDSAALTVFSPDAVIRGEGELLLCDVLSRLDAGEDTPLLEVSQDTPLDVDALAWPARDMLPWQLARHPQASLAASRGCPNRCGFCSIPRPANSRRWRPRDIEDVVEEMRWLNTEYGVCHFYFVDDNFLLGTTASYNRAQHFARLVLTTMPQIRFGFMCRSAAVDKSVFKLLKKAGLCAVFLGIESFSQAVLDRYQKKELVAEHLHAISTLNSLGITINPGFIFFDPWTTAAEARETLRAMRGLDFAALDSVNSKLTCYKGSAIEARITNSAKSLDAPPRLGITEYAFEEKATRELFDECVRLFYRSLTENQAYRLYQRYRFLLGSLQPYLVNTAHEARFLAQFQACKAFWRTADNVVLDWLDAFAQGVRDAPALLNARIDAVAAPCWNAGNQAAEQCIAVARNALLDDLESPDAASAPLCLLAFTLPHPGLGLDAVFKRLAALPPGNRQALARAMCLSCDDNRRHQFEMLLAAGNETLAALCVKAAHPTGLAALLPALEAHCVRFGQSLSPSLARLLARTRELAALSFPELVFTGCPR